MKAAFSIIILTSLSFIQIFAQNSSVYYFNNSGKRVMSIDSADFIRQISQTLNNESTYDVSEFYMDKSLKKIGNSLVKNITPKYNGNVMSYHPNGKKLSTEKYINGKLNGMCYYYYENEVLKEQILYTVDESKSSEKMIQKGDSLGNKFLDNSSSGKFKLVYKNGVQEEGEYLNGNKQGLFKTFNPKLNESYEDLYEGGNFIKGKTIDSNGNTLTYNSILKLAEFKGGTQAFTRFISTNLRYPPEARREGVQGRVVISFKVQIDGSLSDFKINKSVSNEIDEEALRVLKSSPKWIPGQYRGINETVSYTIPITFKL
ncbi:TonB family protein [Pelobium sp.]|nr:energy transducer TonB [Pelobium sp.]MDA9554932.1 TonB family protein [Pelobium sp.]